MSTTDTVQALFAIVLLLSPAWLPLLLIWGFKYKFASPKDIAYDQEVKRTRNEIRRGRVDGYILRDALDKDEGGYYR